MSDHGGVPTPLDALGWNAHWDDELGAHELPAGSRPARVIRVERAVLVRDQDGELTVSTYGLTDVTAGDWLVLDPDDLAVASLARRTTVRRRVSSRRSDEQVLAANVDVVAVVVSLALEIDLGRVERLLSLAWLSGATPLVVLTKADLAQDSDLVAADVAGAAPGVDVVVVSATTGEGMHDLASRLGPGRTLVLLGPSGVGKSTLVNALAGAEIVATGEVGVTGKGRHVTTSRELVMLPSGAVVLDTPGLRGVGMVADDEGLAMAFPEIEELAEGCRFGDCTHVSEPGCAVLEAVESGELPLRRLESWRKLLRETAWMERRTDARLMAEERKRWKAIQQSVRRSGAVRR
jgi:ribosome biogenesis GTPase